MKNFAFLESLLSIFKFCASSNFLFSYELLTGPKPTFLESTLIFLSSDCNHYGYSSHTVTVIHHASFFCILAIHYVSGILSFRRFDRRV